jgi:hypothetical protein
MLKRHRAAISIHRHDFASQIKVLFRQWRLRMARQQRQDHSQVGNPNCRPPYSHQRTSRMNSVYEKNEFEKSSSELAVCTTSREFPVTIFDSSTRHLAPEI